MSRLAPLSASRLLQLLLVLLLLLPVGLQPLLLPPHGPLLPAAGAACMRIPSTACSATAAAGADPG